MSQRLTNLVAFVTHKIEMEQKLKKALRLEAWGEASYLGAYVNGMEMSLQLLHPESASTAEREDK